MEWMTVTSRQNPIVKEVCGLTEKKNRTRSGTFRFDGVKLLGEAIDARLTLSRVIFREDTEERVLPMIESAIERGLLRERDVLRVGESVFEKLSEERAPEGVITVAAMPSAMHETKDAQSVCESVRTGERILLAESLRDPGNLGTVVRSCYALGIDRLVLTSDCADLYNPKTIRAAMGAIFKLPTVTVRAEDIGECIGALRASGRRVFATALDSRAVSIADVGLESGDCFLIGNEGHGLSATACEACDGTVIIPMREGAESLNAAAAAAICIWETVRADKGGCR